MKLLINGNTVTDIVRERMNGNYSNNDIKLASKMLDNVKKNKFAYGKLVITTALILHCNMNFVFAGEIEASMSDTFNQLLRMLTELAKYGCIGMGLKTLIEEMLNGGNFKQASTKGIGFWLSYLFIQFYPRLFDMIKL